MNGQSAPHIPSPSPPSPPGGFFGSVRRLRIWRSHDRWAGGVAAGIAQRYGLDPILVRGLFVVATMFGGLGLVVYGLAWALLPEASDGRIHLEQAIRGHFDIALAGALAVLVIGLSRPVFWWSASWWAVPWIVVVAGIVAVVVLSRDTGSTRTTPAGAGPDPTHPTPPAGAPGAAYAPPPRPETVPSGHGAPVTGTAPHPYDQPEPTTDVVPRTTEDQSEPATKATSRPAYDIPEDHVPQTTAPSDATSGAAPDPVTGLLPTGAVTEPLADPRSGVTEQLPQDPASRPTQTRTASADEAWADGTDEVRSWGESSGWGGSGGWGGGPGGPGTPIPRQPVQPPVPGPGSRTTNLVLAVSLLGAAGIALAHQQGALDGNAWLIGGGAVLTLLGLGVLVSGIRGRGQGGLGVLALLLALVMVPAAAATAALPGFARLGSSATTWAGDPTWAPTTTAAAETGYSLVAGELVVDLTQLDADDDVTIPVGVTFGNLHLIVPEGGDVTIHAGVGAGEVVSRLGEDWEDPSLPVWGSTRSAESITTGVGVTTTLSRDGQGPTIVVDAEVSFGQIHIEETS